MIHKWFVIVGCLNLTTVVSATSATYGKFKTTCAGSLTANHGLIYLHGLQPLSQNSRADNNQLAVKKLAESASLRLAIIDSQITCRRFQDDSFCWPAKTRSEVQQLWRSTLEHARTCFNPSQQKNYLVIGFSNGGYFAAKTILEQSPHPPMAIWAFGIGEVALLSQATTIPWLNKGSLLLSIGHADLERKNAEQFIRTLINRYPNTVRFMPFDGSHEIPAKVILEQWNTIVASHLGLKK